MKSKITILLFSITLLFASQKSLAQMAAMDFTMTDCNLTGTHNLFSDLNSGKVVIVEFFMLSCSPCVVAGQKLESMKTNLIAQYPGKIKSYAFGYTNTYSCSAISNWVTSNGFTSIPSDSGGTQVAYYGGMGMPTIIIAAGASHQLLGSPYVGFTTSDTTGMATNIRNFLNAPANIKNNVSSVSELNIFPNPSSSEVKISFDLTENSNLNISLIDITGKNILNFCSEKMNKGSYIKTINTSLISSGSYFLKISSDGFTTNNKLNIIH